MSEVGLKLRGGGGMEEQIKTILATLTAEAAKAD